jgi:hypothetical protein
VKPIAARLLFLAMLSPLAGAPAPVAQATPAAAPKPYTLFMGVDFDLLRNKEPHRVHNVVGGSFVISVDGKEVHVPMNSQAADFRITQALKLTATSGVIQDLKGERAYTPANDPRKKWAAMGNATDMGNATRNMVAAEVGLNAANAQAASNSRMPGSVAADMQANATRTLNEATQSYNSQAFQGQSDLTNPGLNAARMEEELAKGLFDAIEVTFDVSSEKVLANPYIVILAQYHEPGSKPGMVRNWIYAEAMDPIGPKSQHVHVRQGGLPPGYELQQFQVHLYDAGRELATTASPKSVRLSRDEAFTYLLLDYLGTHKGADLPAAPALGRPEAETKSRLTDAQWRQTYYVKVNKDGLPGAAFTDEACEQPVDELLASLIANVRFYPALEKGKPVEAVARLGFSRLAL